MSAPTYIHRWRMPVIAINGADTVIPFDVRDQAGIVIPLPAAVSVVIERDGVTVASDADVGAMSYTLLNTALSAYEPDMAARWQVRLTITVGSTDFPFPPRPLELVHYEVGPQIIDTDLTEVEPGLTHLLGGDLLDFQAARHAAWTGMLRDLYDRDVSPHQVRDAGGLVLPHTYRAIGEVYRAANNGTGAAVYEQKATQYAEMYTAALHSAALAYDGDNDGIADTKPLTPTNLAEQSPAERFF